MPFDSATSTTRTSSFLARVLAPRCEVFHCSPAFISRSSLGTSKDMSGWSSTRCISLVITFAPVPVGGPRLRVEQCGIVSGAGKRAARGVENPGIGEVGVGGNLRRLADASPQIAGLRARDLLTHFVHPTGAFLD